MLSPKSNEFNLKLFCDKKAEYIVFPIVSPERKKPRWKSDVSVTNRFFCFKEGFNMCTASTIA